jgi:hypothetical protein
VVALRDQSHVEQGGGYVDMQVPVAPDFKQYIRRGLTSLAATH